MNDLTPEEFQQLYGEIARRVENRYGRRAEILTHVIVYLFAMAVFWLLLYDSSWFSAGGALDTIAMALSVLWTMGLMIHFIQWVFNELRDRAIQRELERAGLVTGYRQLMQKAKRDERLVRLSDDGELVDIDSDDDFIDDEEARRLHDT